MRTLFQQDGPGLGVIDEFRVFEETLKTLVSFSKKMNKNDLQKPHFPIFTDSFKFSSKSQSSLLQKIEKNLPKIPHKR